MSDTQTLENAKKVLGQHSYHYLAHLCDCQVGNPDARMNLEDYPDHLIDTLNEHGLLYGGITGTGGSRGSHQGDATTADAEPHQDAGPSSEEPAGGIGS